jgi:hypothetical protein
MVNTCLYYPHYPIHYICKVCQYLWHGINGFILDKYGDLEVSIFSLFTVKHALFVTSTNLNIKYQGQSKYSIPFKKTRFIDITFFSNFFSYSATNNNLYQLLGKYVLQYYYTKRQSLPTLKL